MLNISYSHEVIKKIKSLKNKSFNDLIVVEGLSILEIVCKLNIKIEEFVYCYEEEFSKEAMSTREKCEKLSKNVYTASRKVIESIKEKNNSIGMIAIIKYNYYSVNYIDINKHKFILINDGIEIPGNLGTIYRSAYATGLDLIINVDCKTDISKSKFISSSRGCMFYIPTINTTYDEVQKFLIENNYRIILCEPNQKNYYHEFDYSGNIALIVGSERFGINKGWYNNSHEEVSIPMKGDLNSINVGVAASLILYQAAIDRKIF